MRSKLNTSDLEIGHVCSSKKNDSTQAIKTVIDVRSCNQLRLVMISCERRTWAHTDTGSPHGNIMARPDSSKIRLKPEAGTLKAKSGANDFFLLELFDPILKLPSCTQATQSVKRIHGIPWGDGIVTQCYATHTTTGAALQGKSLRRWSSDSTCLPFLSQMWPGSGIVMV